ncbi:unnamed protein product [Calypogeia fissa]
MSHVLEQIAFRSLKAVAKAAVHNSAFVTFGVRLWSPLEFEIVQETRLFVLISKNEDEKDYLLVVVHTYIPLTTISPPLIIL